ncbi:sulfatase [Halosimplex sp. TS25]|uniref:sulfatase n=1 Tax=Halosimplex rarum TaxID=3396619 RepID=UPI0039E7F0F1
MITSAGNGTSVVLIVLDTARAKTVLTDGRRVDGEAFPELSRLADEGVVVPDAFATAPWTLPSHASLFTGAHSSRHGAHADHKRLEEEHPTIAEAFAAAGYETVAVSNNTWVSEEFGFARGFDTFFKTWQYVQSDTDLGRVAREHEGADMFQALIGALADGNPIVNVMNALYGRFFRKTDDDGAARTNEWIADWLVNRDPGPFFLFVNYLEPHLEYRPPRTHADRFLPDGVEYNEAMAVEQDAWGYVAGTVDITEREFEILRALYRAELAYIDDRIGELRSLLEAAGEWEDTVVVVTGDHGENVGEHGLMDHQYCLYDTLLHVPLILHGGPFTGGAVDGPVQLTDVAPTLLDAAGVEAPAFREAAQGRSFHPEADATSRTWTVAEYMAPQPSMAALEDRVGELPSEVRRYDRELRSIRTSEWKLVRGSDETTELYRVAEDPEEMTDLAAEYPDVRDRLVADLDGWCDSFEHVEYNDDVEMGTDTTERLEDLGYLQ